MKLHRFILPMFFMASTPSFATTLDFTQTFSVATVGSFTLHFAADSASPTTITALTSSTLNGDSLTLLTPGTLGGNDNLFHPASINTSAGGWDGGGLSFQDVTTGDQWNLYDGGSSGFSVPGIWDSLGTVSGGGVPTVNFTTASTPATTVDEPATLGLLAIAGLAMLRRHRRICPQPA